MRNVKGSNKLRVQRQESELRRRRVFDTARAFTLVEVVVVVLIVAILSVVVASKLIDISFDSMVNGTVTQVDAFNEAVELYRATNGNYPPTTTSSNAESTFGPYLHTSFFSRPSPIGAGPYAAYSKPIWLYYKSGSLEYGYLRILHIDAAVAEELDAIRDDGVATTGDIRYTDYRPYGYDYGHLFIYSVRSF